MRCFTLYEKLTQADIEEIITEHLMRKYAGLFYSKVELMGTSGQDLRCVCAFCDDKTVEKEYLDLVDEKIGYTGKYMKNDSGRAK